MTFWSFASVAVVAIVRSLSQGRRPHRTLAQRVTGIWDAVDAFTRGRHRHAKLKRDLRDARSTWPSRRRAAAPPSVRPGATIGLTTSAERSASDDGQATTP